MAGNSISRAVGKNGIHAKATLMQHKKETLVDHILALEHNVKVLNDNFENQYSNCLKMVNDMAIVNKGYKNRSRQEPTHYPATVTGFKGASTFSVPILSIEEYNKLVETIGITNITDITY